MDNPRRSSVDTGETPLLTSTPATGAGSSHPQPTEETFQEFFRQHYDRLESMFMNHFSSRQEKGKATTRRKAKKTLEFIDDTSSGDERVRSITPMGESPEEGRRRSMTQDRPYVHQTFRRTQLRGTPFSRHIAHYATPQEFRIPPNIKLYDGTTDPDDHLNTYNNTMNIYALPMPVWCKVFPATLTDKARLWFERLPPGSISSYQELESQFRTHFSQMKRFQRTKAEFMAIRQEDSEPLRQFVDRFNNESLQLVDRSEDFLISAFINGLRHGELYRDLISKPPHTMASLLEQADDFARADEADKRKREEADRRPDKEKGKEHDHQSGRRSVLDRLSRPRSTRAYSPMREQFTPLLRSAKEIYALTKGRGILRPPLKMQTPSHKRNKDHYCEYHEDHGHKTDDCNDLKREIEMCVKNGQLSRFVKDVKHTDSEIGSDHRRDRERSRGKDRSLEETYAPRDSRRDYNWRRASREGTTPTG